MKVRHAQITGGRYALALRRCAMPPEPPDNAARKWRIRVSFDVAADAFTFNFAFLITIEAISAPGASGVSLSITIGISARSCRADEIGFRSAARNFRSSYYAAVLISELETMLLLYSW